LPGYKIAVEKCGICHSADYINLQPPQMSLAQWTAEMVKMQHAYGAPIDDAEIKLLGIYLASTYGDAATVTAADIAAEAPGVHPEAGDAAGAGGDAGVHAILDRNACLSCHATQQKVVGPAYHDVAAKYSGDRNARSKIEANIRAGGTGKWGAVPMPPFPNLSPADLQALADFVLKQ
jgi:cytochrome c551/c552